MNYLVYKELDKKMANLEHKDTPKTHFCLFFSTVRNQTEFLYKENFFILVLALINSTH